MSRSSSILLLDGLFDDIEVERTTAARAGWSLERWDGSESRLRDAQVVLHVRTKIDRAFLDRMPACRVVARFGTGLDTVDQASTDEREIRVVGVRDYCVPELATHTLGLAFALDRRIEAARDARLRPDDTWQAVSTQLPIPGRRTATVIGFGSIGRAITRALIAVGIKVQVVTRHGASEAEKLSAEPADLDEALANAGFVFLHCALEQDTVGLINQARLERMTPGTILLNTARIGLLDEAAVADALAQHHLSGLGLDAKLDENSPLRKFVGDPRLLLTPHIGWYSDRSARELRERTVRNAIAAFKEVDRVASLGNIRN